MALEKVPLIVRRSMLKELIGISPTQVARLEADPSSGFPPRRQWSARVCGWHGPDLAAWVAEHGTVIVGKRGVAGKGGAK